MASFNPHYSFKFLQIGDWGRGDWRLGVTVVMVDDGGSDQRAVMAIDD